jgi:hypothetical protein
VLEDQVFHVGSHGVSLGGGPACGKRALLADAGRPHPLICGLRYPFAPARHSGGARHDSEMLS